MKLKELTIEIIPSYEKEAGKYRAKIKYENERGSVDLNLDSGISEALLAVIGPTITKFSHRACMQLEETIEQSLVESSKVPVIQLEEAK